MKALITGGCRSGKSRRAQALAESLAADRVYLATAEPLDAEMSDRIRRHQADRGPTWRTIESPIDIAPHLHQPGAVVLVDCLTLWVSNLLYARGEASLDDDFVALHTALRTASNPVVLVTNEVGLGIVPANPLARRFRDEAGLLAQRLAADCDRVELLVAGIPLILKDHHP
ncbi:bifunctional adenosylcobinamide kinase/adenosylcobinamide-phosphate guanylyltransferase [Myxococcota bacterium]|nr:bifunctional adenosylcobinamide kinase/adenosylcobinamide-phosphate guanylyltransferase [Myxococcota bacterium]